MSTNLNQSTRNDYLTEPPMRGQFQRTPVDHPFNHEPPNTFLLKMTGHEILIPKYNGVQWWFPVVREDQPSLEFWISFAFHVVESMQTLSLSWWSARLVYQFGLVKTVSSYILAIQVGGFLEDVFGKNKGSAYASFQAVYVTFQVFDYLSVALESYSKAAIVLLFIIGAFVIASSLAILENCIGRTTFATLTSYPQFISWVCMIPSVIGRVAFIAFMCVMILRF